MYVYIYIVYIYIVYIYIHYIDIIKNIYIYMSLIKPRDGNATSGASLPRNFGVEVLQVLALKKKNVDRGPDLWNSSGFIW